MKKVYKLSEEHKKKIADAHRGIRRPGIGGRKPGGIPWNKGKKVNTIPWNKGKKMAKEIILKAISIRRKNNSYHNHLKGTKGILKSNKTSFKKGLTPWNKDRKYLAISGEKNPNWKGGVTPINHKIRTSLEYKLWRKAVFERDNYTCIWCGSNKSGSLNADHIKPFAYFPEIRFAIDNGRTLCIDCHKTTPSYLKKLTTGLCSPN